MNQPYPIINLPPAARSRVEQMGTKEKFWFKDATEIWWLFKYNRRGHGDDWSEKIACEIAGKLDLPHAHVELAMFEESRGVLSRDFTERGRFPLIHGNELLANIVNPLYPKHQNYKVTEHTVQSVRRILDEAWITRRVLAETSVALANYYADIEGVASASDLFAGYLMLDALIGNTDRHHENWAIIRAGRQLCLAPTFDHASCLGFNLSDAERTDRMTPGRNRSVETFADKALSKLYLAGADRPLTPLAAFAETTKDRPAARRAWIDRLRRIADNDLWAIIDRVPTELMSKPARDFAVALLRVNRDRILGLEQ
ncbi:MAG: HipA domain-containing protein [Tepidisphaeraceae bacterium]